MEKRIGRNADKSRLDGVCWEYYRLAVLMDIPASAGFVAFGSVLLLRVMTRCMQFGKAPRTASLCSHFRHVICYHDRTFPSSIDLSTILNKSLRGKGSELILG